MQRVNSCFLLKDIINDEEIKLDLLFKASLVHDIVNVSQCKLLLILVAKCFHS